MVMEGELKSGALLIYIRAVFIFLTEEQCTCTLYSGNEY